MCTMPARIPGTYEYFVIVHSHFVFLTSFSQTRQLVLKHEGAENFNWNYVDQHVLGYQEFAELPEVSTSLSTAT